LLLKTFIPEKQIELEVSGKDGLQGIIGKISREDCQRILFWHSNYNHSEVTLQQFTEALTNLYQKDVAFMVSKEPGVTVIAEYKT
jgi:hypothetical protein